MSAPLTPLAREEVSAAAVPDALHGDPREAFMKVHNPLGLEVTIAAGRRLRRSWLEPRSF